MEWLKNEKAMKELQKHKNPNKRKQQKKTVRRFFQSGVSDMDNNPLFLCRNAVVEIFNIGYYRMFKLSKYVDLPEIPMHGLAGKAPTWAKSASRVSCDEGLKLFFEDLKHEAEPHATRVVRERTQVGLRDDDIDLIELPSSMTKRNLYHQFCYGRGYKMRVSANGSYGHLSEAEQREGDPDDESWPEGSIPLPICSYGYFWVFWKKHYPKLAIRPPSRDTCDECFQYSNVLGAHKRKQNDIERQAVREISAAQDEDDDERLILDGPDSEDEEGRENDESSSDQRLGEEETTGG
jgi:hypothetical protein